MRVSRVVYVSGLTMALVACGGGGDDIQAEPAQNKADPKQSLAKPDETQATGRTWRVGQSLESGTTSVRAYGAGMADSTGQVVVVFVQYVGQKPVLYATSGLPGLGQSAPVWKPPLPIDGGVSPKMDTGSGAWDLGLSVAPNGRAYATWFTEAPCTARTYKTTGNCQYLYGVAFDGANWGVPEVVSDSVRLYGTPVPRVNSNGDIAVLYGGYVNPGNSTSSQRVAVASRMNGQSGFSRLVFTDWPLGSYVHLGKEVNAALDAQRNLLVAGQNRQAGFNRVVVRRGQLGGGFRVQEIIGAEDSGFLSVSGGSNGQGYVQWRQKAIGARSDTVWGASTTTPTAAWQVQNFGTAPRTNFDGWTSSPLVGPAAGHGLFYQNTCGRRVWTPSLAAFGALQKLPKGCETWQSAANRRAEAGTGDLLWLTNDGRWSTYELATGRITKPIASSAAADYLFGFALDSSTTARLFGANLGNSTLMVSSSGVGALVTRGEIAALPTVANKRWYFK
jgi:hypothetical protein